MAGQLMQLIINIHARPEDDAEKLAELTRQLRTELMELDIESANLVRAGKIPAGAKTGEPITWGALLVTLAASGGVLTALINVLQSWLTRHEQRGVSLEVDGDKLEVKGMSSQEQQQLIDAWLSRHRGIVIAND